MGKTHYIILFLFLVLSAAAQNDNSQWGLVIKDLDNDSVVLNQNGREKMTPASVTKLMTTATALEILGPDYQFITDIRVSGEVNEKGVLEGDLCVIGGLDPTIESEAMGCYGFLDSVAHHVKELGIKKIAGDIIVDGGITDGLGVSPKWLLEDLATYYGVGCYGMSIYDNVQKMHIKNGKITFQYEDYEVVDRTKRDHGKWANVDVYTLPKSEVIVVEGVIGSRASANVRVSINNPMDVAAKSLKKRLEKAGVDVEGKAEGRDFGKEIPGESIYKYVSPKLKDIIRVVNVTSNNHFAEHIFRNLGAQNDERGATVEDSKRVIQEYWSDKGLDLSNITLFDGNGLSPMDAISPEMVVGLLERMSKSENAEYFKASLPLCGYEGTVKDLFVDSDMTVRAKSGSMTGVQAYAGYISFCERNFVFCVIVNEFDMARKDLRYEITRKIIQALDNYACSFQRD